MPREDLGFWGFPAGEFWSVHADQLASYWMMWRIPEVPYVGTLYMMYMLELGQVHYRVEDITQN